jgi:hypothetical protein
MTPSPRNIAYGAMTAHRATPSKKALAAHALDIRALPTVSGAGRRERLAYPRTAAATRHRTRHS